MRKEGRRQFFLSTHIRSSSLANICFQELPDIRQARKRGTKTHKEEPNTDRRWTGSIHSGIHAPRQGLLDSECLSTFRGTKNFPAGSLSHRPPALRGRFPLRWEVMVRERGREGGRLMRCETRVLDRFRLNQGRLRPRVDKERQDFLSTVCGYLLIKYQFFITAPHHHRKTSIMGHSFRRSFFSISEKNRCFL